MSVTETFVSATSTVRDAIVRIDATGRQIALVVDEDGRLVGVVTDGDIRRGILRGVALDAPVDAVVNTTPHVVTTATTDAARAELMQRYGIRHVPVLDEAGVVVELATADGRRPPRTDTPVVLMAGGRGQRLYPLTKDVPKPMLPVGGVPLLEIILRNLAAQGFSEIRISVNYLAEVIIDHIGDGSRLGLHVQYLHEDKPLGTAGALSQLSGVIDRPFLVMNSDLLTRVDFRRLLAFHERQGARGTVGVREYAHEIPFGVVDLDGSQVVSMVEKPVHRALVNAGIYALDPSALELLKPGDYCDMPTLLGMILEAGDRVSAFPIHEDWLDVGRPEDLTEARSEAGKWTP